MISKIKRYLILPMIPKSLFLTICAFLATVGSAADLKNAAENRVGP